MAQDHDQPISRNHSESAKQKCGVIFQEWKSKCDSNKYLNRKWINWREIAPTLIDDPEVKLDEKTNLLNWENQDSSNNRGNKEKKKSNL